MKRFFMAVILLLFLFTAAACSGKEKSEDAGAENGSTKDTGKEGNSSEDEIDDAKSETDGKEGNTGETDGTDYKALSEDLALQMAGGDFDQTYDIMSPIMKAQLKKDSLKSTWDATVAGLGKLIGIYDTKEETVDQYQVVQVVLQYENNGLKVSLTYTESGKLDGLWINYAPIETELEVNDDFAETKASIGVGEYPVDGILTLPNGVVNPPVVILVPGSGNHDMDESVGANKPFRDIARGLAKQGIASIRYQERFIQYPELFSADFTIQGDCLEDAAQAVEYAVACGKVDPDRVYIIGHSLGGMMAPKIAADNDKVAGIVCLAGSPRKLEDIVMDQQSLLLGASGTYSQDEIDDLLAMAAEQAEEIKKLKDGDSKALLGIPTSYWYSLNQINTGEIVEELTIPIFIAQGSEDWQVYADKDYVAWQELLGDRDNVTFHLYDNLNHLFMTSQGLMDISEYNVKGAVDQQVIDDIAAWIHDGE